MYLAVRRVYQDRTISAYRREPPGNADASMTLAAKLPHAPLSLIITGPERPLTIEK